MKVLHETDLCIRDVQRTNAERCQRWHGHPSQQWSGLEWAGAMCGEAGEAANVAKKLRRLEQGMIGNGPDDDAPHLTEKLADECADVFLYLCLLASHYEIDMTSAIRAKFNRKSEEQGFPERL